MADAGDYLFDGAVYGGGRVVLIRTQNTINKTHEKLYIDNNTG